MPISHRFEKALTRDEEKALFKIAQDATNPKAEEARETLVNQFLLFSYKVAEGVRQAAGCSGASGGDVEGTAHASLLKAIDSFNPDFGAPFAAYLRTIITREARRVGRSESRRLVYEGTGANYVCPTEGDTESHDDEGINLRDALQHVGAENLKQIIQDTLSLTEQVVLSAIAGGEKYKSTKLAEDVRQVSGHTYTSARLWQIYLEATKKVREALVAKGIFSPEDFGS